MMGIGIWDMHCPTCAHVEYTGNMAFVFCTRCGDQMSFLAPLADKAAKIEADWLRSPRGKEWSLKQVKAP